MATCSKCDVEHFRFRDVGHTKPQSLCGGCHSAYMRENRPKHSELGWLQKLKVNARSMANVYQSRGNLVRCNCVDCGSTDSQKHHENYYKPLEVTWLCRECHLKRHKKEKSWIHCGPNAWN